MDGAAGIISRILKRVGEYCGKIEVEGEWKNLSDDLVWMIVSKLGDIADRVRMRMVCKSWNSIIILPPQIPWLLLPHDANPKSMKFYDMSCDKVQEIRLPSSSSWFGSTSTSTKGWYCFGSSKGWLVVVEKYDSLLLPIKNKFNIFLFNPITGDRHQLPCLKTVPAFHNNYLNNSYDMKVLYFINRIELSSEDLSKCVVAAVLDAGHVLACCRPKDQKWTVLDKDALSDRQGEYYTSILFSNEILYATFNVNYNHRQSKIVAKSYTMKLLSDDNFEVSLKLLPSAELVGEGDNVETRLMCEEPQAPELHTEFDAFGLHCADISDTPNYLIEVNGDILLIRKHVDIFWPNVNSLEIDDDEADFIYNNSAAQYQKAKSFDVFKVSLDEHTDDEGCTPFSLSRVKSLDSGVLFLAKTGSAYAKHTPQNGRSNCIYFADDFLYHFRRYDPHVSRETGIYDLKSGNIQRPFPSIKIPRESNMCWFAPILDKCMPVQNKEQKYK